MTKDDVKNLAKQITKKAFFHYYFDDPKKDNTEQIPLDIFFPQERKISSLILGLSTSLGTTLWEELAEAIAKTNGFNVLDPKDLEQPSPIPKELSGIIDEFTSKRDEGMKRDEVFLKDEYIPRIKKLTKEAHDDLVYKSITKGDGVDVLIEKDGKEYAFDIKTVQINAGSGVKYNKTILKWYAYRHYQMNSVNENYEFEARIVFPYNPHKDATWWEKEGGKAKPLTKDDVFVEDEFWGFLSGLDENETWEGIKEAFTELRDEGFNEIYKESFGLKGKIFRAVLFADRIGCELLTPADDGSIDKYKSKTSSLKWKCKECGAAFEASINNIIKNQKDKQKCPGCRKIFFNDINDLH